MSFMSEYRAALKKKKKDEEVTTSSKVTTAGSGIKETSSSFMDDYRKEKSRLLAVQEEEEDIAPVLTRVSSQEDEERSWFRKGLFEDGYQFGDVSKTILGSTTDVLENLGTGVIGMGEKAVDALAYIAPFAADAQFYQNGGFNLETEKAHKQVVEQSKKDIGKFIAKDLYDEEAVAKAIISNPVRKVTGVDSEAASVFGEKSDSLVQSAGQLAATVGLQAAGVPWWVSYGVTSFGEEAENALNQDATYEEAGLSATISAAAEVLTEKLSGGIKFGGKAVDDVLTKQIARSISNKYLRTGLKLGLDMIGEGAEEWITADIQKFGQWLTYQDEEELKELLFSEEAMDEKIEAFIGGVALGGGISTVNAVKTSRKGIDYATEMTENEKKVVDKVYQDRVAELEQNGKVTEKQKSKVYDEVLNDFEKGYISTETIEEVLGGENYQRYKQTVDSENALLDQQKALQEEFDTLNKMKQGEMTGEQIDRRADLKVELAKIKETIKSTQNHSARSLLKQRLSDSVSEMVRSDRLIESYNEQSRRGQAFEADLTQYDEKQQQTIQNAINSGTLNNTRRTHELVDFIAKVSADKGVPFDFTNNEKIKGTRFAVEGKTVNGYVTESGITLNVQSPKYLESTVGHEITHVLEGTEFYDTLKQTIFDYAKSKGEYDSRMSSLTEMYKNIEGADVEAELTADLVGDYIFSDTDFVNKLSTENRNVFQKIYDEIKYLCKVATAGSKEARQLEKVKKVFEDAYRASGKQSETKYSLSELDNAYRYNVDKEDMVGAQFAVEQAANNAGYDIEAYHGTDADFYTFSLGNRGRHGEKLGVGYYFTNNKEAADLYSNHTGKVKHVFLDIKKPISHEIMTISEKEWGKFLDYATEHRDEYIDGIWKGNSINKDFEIRDMLYFDNDADLIKTFIDVTAGRNSTVAEGYLKMLKDSIGYDGVKYENGDAKVYVAFTPEQIKSADTVTYDDNGNVIPLSERFNTENPDIRYSLSDSDGKQLTKEQQDYFKDSKMRDDNGNLKVMYHGSQDAGFHVFDAKMSDDDTSFFFVDRNDVAATYSGTSETYEAKTIRTAEDMNNFLAEIGYDHYEAVEKNGKFVLYEDGDYVATSDTAQGIYDEFCWYEGVGNGDANYKVYLNLKNPLEVDAEGRNWNNVSREFSQEVYDKYQTLTEEEKAAFVDLAEWEDYDLFRSEIHRALDEVEDGSTDENYRTIANAYWKVGNTSVLFDLASENFTDEALRENAFKKLNTRDFAQKAKQEGYDGVIFKNIVDVGGYGNGSEGAATVAIAFDSNQIKSVANEKPTADPDIRFSLSEAVEETKDLMALHNLHTNEVLKQLEMGGMPYPSVAITNPAKIAHDDFGEISLVLHKDAIDPKKNKYNHIYSSDAYTPTFPHVSYEANREVAERISNRIKAQFDKLPDYYQRSIRSLRDYTNLNDKLNSWGGMQGLIDSFAYDHGMKQVYLAEKGENVPMEIERTETQLSDLKKEQYQKVVDKIGAEELASLNDRGNYNTLSEARIAWTKEHLDTLKDIYAEDWSSDGSLSKEEALEIANEENLFFWYKEAVGALEYMGNGGITVVEKEDYNATNAKIDEKTNDSDYKQWLAELFGGIEGQSGIRNNKDTFLPSGKRRSFTQLHDPVTIDNVIKAMRKKEQTGQGAFGTGNFGGAAVQEYGSIAEAKRNSNMLGVIDETEYKDIKKSIDDRLFDITYRYANGKDIIDAKTTIVEAVAKNESKAGIARYLKQYDYVYKYTDSIGDDIIELRDYVRSLPRPYFEAKPRRAVGFDEVAVFVIPYDADVKLKQELLNRGYAIAEYDPKVEGDRQRVVNQFEEYKFSLSNVGDTPYGNRGTLGKDIALAPVAENSTVSETESVDPTVAENATVTPAEMADMFPDNLAPVQDELERLEAERNEIYGGLEAALEHGSDSEVGQLAAEYDSITARIRELEADDNQRTDSLTDADIPPEMEAPYTETTNAPVENPFEDREWSDVVGKKGRKAKAYMYEHPEVKPFFQAEAQNLLGEWSDTQRGERIYNDQLHYDTGGEKGWMGIKRMASQSMETLLDEWGMSYGEIEKGLKAIIEDHGAENISAAKKIEFMLNDRLLNGYKNFYDRGYVQPNQDYINLLEEMQINSYSKEAFDAFMATADQYAPADIAPVKPLAKATPDTMTAPLYESKDKTAVKGQTTMFEPPKPNPKVANVLTEESAIEKEKSGIGMKLTSALVDKGMVFENLSLKHGNHELQAKWNYALPSNTEARAQYFMENGAKGVKSLKDIQKKVDKSGKADDFFNYLYHVHNIDRMTLEDRFGVENKTVFGETVTADVSRRKVAQFEKANPEFKNWANDVYAYNRHLRNLLVENSVISQDTADLWEKMYPHYVPIRRVDAKGQNISVPLDTNKTGVNNPIKKATGGSSDIQPVFSTMAQRTEQTYRAIARNAFGIELKNTLGSTLNSQKNTTGVDETIDTLVSQEDHLLKPGAFGNNPTFTVFENGERVEFEITEDMFDALKPAGKLLGYRNKAINAVGNARRNLLTTLNPVFALYRNPIKDMQDVAINSQHATRTYLNVPYAIVSLVADTNVAKAIFGNTAVGKYASEYHENGGKSNTYFDSRTNQFKAEDSIFKKAIGLPVRAIENAGEFIEEIPRLAEYIASRQSGRSVERSMLDAARVTTNFAAGGDFTKFLNSHGFTFLNASVQGVSQHVRNFREAKQQGLKGYVKVLAKYTIAGLPTILLNSMLWDDDEEYEELSDYVKQNYYVVAKTEDGKFVRIPKGRTAAVMGELMNQMQNLVTGDDEADFSTFYELFMNNIAPNNPIENNILAPIMQVKNNEAWYGGDLVPSRLHDLPAAEQFDESTDSFSKWLGEKTNTSPYKWNYLLDQYSGGLGDMVLPTLTPEAESGDNSLMGNILAPWKKEITTDMVLNNKNPGDFYDLKDELEKLSNSKNATEEDSMRSMYMDSVSWEMGDLYAQKREWQNSGFSDAKKYEKVREIQEQINELAKAAMEGYNDVSIDGLYSEVGDRRYNKDAESGKWYEIREKNSDGTDNYYYQKEQEVTQALGISYGEYWNNREEYNYAYDKPEQYALSQAVGGYDSYRGYTSKLWDIKADKDENGKSINGSRKDKVIDYLNELDIDYYHKIILFKNEYNADDTYNEEIIDYLNGREDISYQQMETILKYLGFEVDSEGNISWD